MAVGKLFPHCIRKPKNCDPRDFSANNNPRPCSHIKNTAHWSSLELPIPHVCHVPEVFEKQAATEEDGE